VNGDTGAGTLPAVKPVPLIPTNLRNAAQAVPVANSEEVLHVLLHMSPVAGITWRLEVISRL